MEVLEAMRTVGACRYYKPDPVPYEDAPAAHVEDTPDTPTIETLVAVIGGYVDHVMDSVGTRLIGSYSQVTEAMRRRRVEAAASDRFVERLLGLELTQEHFDRGRAFVDGVEERAGRSGLERLWSSDDVLPTPNELVAPGLWLARIDL